jgi:hypothetical protein
VEGEMTCGICQRGCTFKTRSVNGRIVKMIPERISECCSLGLFGYPLKDNISDEMLLQEQEIKKYLSSSLEKYMGKSIENLSLWELITKIV